MNRASQSVMKEKPKQVERRTGGRQLGNADYQGLQPSCSRHNNIFFGLQMEQVLEGLFLEAMRLSMSFLEILQMRVKYGSYCALFLFLMMNESAKEESLVNISSGLCDHMRTAEAREASS